MEGENRQAGRGWKTIVTIKDLLLIDSGFPLEFWAKTMEMAKYLRNYLPTKIHRGEIIPEPEEAWTEKNLDLDIFVDVRKNLENHHTWDYDQLLDLILVSEPSLPPIHSIPTKYRPVTSFKLIFAFLFCFVYTDSVPRCPLLCVPSFFLTAWLLNIYIHKLHIYIPPDPSGP